MNSTLQPSDLPETRVASPAVPRFAATLMVLRDGQRGHLEVLMLRRAERGSDIFSGSCVFPGGTVDSRDAQLHGCCSGLDDSQASATLGLPEGGLDLYVAAVRETFEEAGLLIAREADGRLVNFDRLASPEVAAMRTALQEGEQGFAGLCARLGITLAVDRLAYASHWLTPLGMPKRFDTRFFVTVAPESQTAAHDDRETLQHLWLRPAEALAQAKALKLMPVTQGQLKMLSAFDSAEACFQATLATRDIRMVVPRVAQGADGREVVLPGTPAYAEIGRLDPLGHGQASSRLTPGVAVRLSPRVIRVTANNGSMMTGPGTNTYLIGGVEDAGGGGASNEWAVLDPGPLEDDHVAAILAAAPGPITRIVVTHTHKDHSPAAAALKVATGATLHGQAARHDEWQDTGFRPDLPLVGGERIEVAPGTTLRVIHTPGHASNHLCYLLEEERLLFTGDHVMQGSTVVINPPDGDMSAYISSLIDLAGVDLEWLAPGHGFLIDQPSQAIRRIVAHRLKRETKVLDAVRSHGPASIDDLLPVVYDDVSPHLFPPARRSLMAHLGKLKDDAKVVDRDGCWTMTEL